MTRVQARLIMDIRSATPKDVPAIVALVTRTLAEFGIAFGEGTPTDEQLKALPNAYEDSGGRFCQTVPIRKRCQQPVRRAAPSPI